MSRAYGLNGLNQTTASGSLTVSYDGRGNVSSDGVNTYAYDVANRLTSMSSSATLSYDPLSRLSKTVGSATTQFLYDGTDLIAEFDGSGNLLRRYIHGPGSDEPVAWYEGSGTANRQWLLANAQGSVVAVTNASGGVTATNTYDEYGLPGSNNVGRFQYTGQKWIPEIGMYDYKARIYSPGFGRFLQTDPIGYGDGPNWYGYVHGDPVNGRDPSGRECVWDDGSYDSVDDPDTGSPDQCSGQGGRWVDHQIFVNSNLPDWAASAGPNGVNYVYDSLTNSYVAQGPDCSGGASTQIGLSYGFTGFLGNVGLGSSVTVGISLQNDGGGFQFFGSYEVDDLTGLGLSVGTGVGPTWGSSPTSQSNNLLNETGTNVQGGAGWIYGAGGSHTVLPDGTQSTSVLVSAPQLAGLKGGAYVGGGQAYTGQIASQMLGCYNKGN